MNRDSITAAFAERFGAPPAHVVRAPGRVNLIGEHTDYNDGFVLPIAIDRAVWIALRPRADGRVVLHGCDFGEVASFALDALDQTVGGWQAYVQGVAWGLQQGGHAVKGWEGVLASDVPIGAGLSSSAAVELAVARAFALVGGWAWEPIAMALLAQRVENEWVGMSCGIMDQMVVAAATEGAALLIDCRSLALAPTPLPPGMSVVVLDTGTRRGLVDSAYNERRAQCEAAAALLGVPALRDVTEEELEAARARLDPLVYRRARHVVSENARTLAALEAMQAGDAGRLGALLDASHASLRDDFEVSSPALDAIVQRAQDHPACIGARMTGAGFGGCAVAVVDAGAAGDFAEAVATAYRTATGLDPQVYVCRATAGVSAC